MKRSRVPRRLIISLLSATEQSSFEHIKTFVKGLNRNVVGFPLQFWTGSNIIDCDTITVTFTNVDGTTGCPIIKTPGSTHLISLRKVSPRYLEHFDRQPL